MLPICSLCSQSGSLLIKAVLWRFGLISFITRLVCAAVQPNISPRLLKAQIKQFHMDWQLVSLSVPELTNTASSPDVCHMVVKELTSQAVSELKPEKMLQIN
ncbi:hypothetical protein V6N13_089966 [Hibiscus sabdariffa]